MWNDLLGCFTYSSFIFCFYIFVGENIFLYSKIRKDESCRVEKLSKMYINIIISILYYQESCLTKYYSKN